MATNTQVKLFEKKLTEVDINNGLVLEADSLVLRPESGSENGYVDFNAMDEEGRFWPFRCLYRVGGIATKPVILGGWGEFVRLHGLKVKDKVSFYGNQEEGNAVPFVIHIRRTIRLFGVDITEAD